MKTEKTFRLAFHRSIAVQNLWGNMSQGADKYIKFFEKHRIFFSWLRFFYPKARGVPILYQLYFFFPQKILRINGTVPWPVHFTSRILYHRNISVGNMCAPGMNAGCYIQARNKIEIGHNLRMGPGVGLISSNHRLDDYDRYTEEKPIMIGDNVWIGMHAVILPGVTIGDNVVIAANSVVTKDVPSNVIVAGNPCKTISEKGPYMGIDYSKC